MMSLLKNVTISLFLGLTTVTVVQPTPAFAQATGTQALAALDAKIAEMEIVLANLEAVLGSSTATNAEKIAAQKSRQLLLFRLAQTKAFRPRLDTVNQAYQIAVANYLINYISIS